MCFKHSLPYKLFLIAKVGWRSKSKGPFHKWVWFFVHEPSKYLYLRKKEMFIVAKLQWEWWFKLTTWLFISDLTNPCPIISYYLLISITSLLPTFVTSPSTFLSFPVSLLTIFLTQLPPPLLTVYFNTCLELGKLWMKIFYIRIWMNFTWKFATLQKCK